MRAPPPLPQTGLIQAKMGADEDIKSATGQYNASLGMQGNERSGKAIVAREKQGDVGTYHYVDNLARAIRHVTRQLVDMIPKIYDTQRVARIIGLDGEVSMVKINPDQQQPVNTLKDQNGGTIEKIYNPNVGTYDVMVTTGPGYMTKRQEALDAMDWPGAQEMAERFKKILDPKVLEGGDMTPELAAAQQQIQAMAQELQQSSTILENIQDSVAQQEIQIKGFEAEIRAYDAETKRISAVQNSMTPEQIQDIVMGTMHAAMDMGDLVPPSLPQLGNFGTDQQQEQPGEAPEMPMQPEQQGEPPETPMQPPMAPEGLPQ